MSGNYHKNVKIKAHWKQGVGDWSPSSPSFCNDPKTSFSKYLQRTFEKYFLSVFLFANEVQYYPLKNNEIDSVTNMQWHSDLPQKKYCSFCLFVCLMQFLLRCAQNLIYRSLNVFILILTFNLMNFSSPITTKLEIYRIR